jgi:hypothetical protein
MSEHLHHKLEVLHQSLLNGKLPRTLHWNDTLELIGHLGDVEARGGDEFAFVIGTQREYFKRPRTPEFGTEEVSRLRKFLKNAAAEPTPVKLDHSCRLMVVVIDHRAAHVFRDAAGSQLVHHNEAHYRGDRDPDEASFYEEVATALAPANEIVLIGHGTGKSNAAKVLAEYLQKHHPELSRLVKATETADLSALTATEAEAIAEQYLMAVV